MQPRSGFREDSRWAVNFFCQSECRELKDILFLKFICCALAALQQPSLHVEWSQPLTRSFPNINKVALTKTVRKSQLCLYLQQLRGVYERRQTTGISHGKSGGVQTNNFKKWVGHVTPSYNGSDAHGPRGRG